MTDTPHFFCSSSVRPTNNCAFVDKVWGEMLSPMAGLKSDVRQLFYNVPRDLRVTRQDFEAAALHPRGEGALHQAYLRAFDADGNGKLEGAEREAARQSVKLEGDHLFGLRGETDYSGIEFWLRGSTPDELAQQLKDNAERDRELKGVRETPATR